MLWQDEVLDTVPEEVFDDLANLAANSCDAPIGLISLGEEDRQRFKARTGITVSETARDNSFCAHAILDDELLVVPDATKDKRFKSNPLVTGSQNIRFYAGAPLITPDGHALGTRCVLDSNSERNAPAPEPKWRACEPRSPATRSRRTLRQAFAPLAQPAPHTRPNLSAFRLPRHRKPDGASNCLSQLRAFRLPFSPTVRQP